MPKIGWFCLLVGTALWLVGCGSSHSDLLPVEVRGVVLDPETQAPVLFLVDPESERGLPVWIGLSEARAITLGLQNAKPPRPLTHDLMKRMLELLDARVERVVISGLKENTYYATLSLRSGRKTWEVDSRPSDAVAIGLKFGAPLFLSRSLAEKGVLVDLGSSPQAMRPGRVYGFSTQELSPQIARYFRYRKKTGVIVTEIDRDSPAERAGLKRGDILVRLDKKSIKKTDDVRNALEGRDASKSVRVEVYRTGEVLSLEIRP
jgi:hypothetical protein